MIAEVDLRGAFAAMRQGESTQAKQPLAPVQRAQPRRGRQPEAKPQRKPMPNRYGGRCKGCSGYVEAGMGVLTKEGEKWVVAHAGECPAPEPVAEQGRPNPPVWPGIYTLDAPPSGVDHRTFRVRVQAEDDDFAPGETILEHLTGPDNTSDYTSVAFIKPGPRLVMWRRYRDNQGLVDDAQAFLADPEATLKVKNCLRCNAELTTPESIQVGYGPVCVTKVS